MTGCIQSNTRVKQTNQREILTRPRVLEEPRGCYLLVLFQTVFHVLCVYKKKDEKKKCFSFHFSTRGGFGVELFEDNLWFWATVQ